MATQLNNFKQRAITGLVILILASTALIFGSWMFFLLVFLLSLLMSLEFDYLRNDNFKSILLSFLPILAAKHIELALGLTVLGAAIPLMARKKWLALSVVYVAIPAICLIWLREQTYGLYAIFWLIFVVIGTDIGAYFAGSFFGKHKLAPKTSPNKTWEGLLGGVILAAFLSFFFTGFSFTFLLIGGLMAVIEQVSDLMESAIKRHYGVKDTGNILPGHGGVMDRLDGLVLTVPIVAALSYFGVLTW